MLLVVLCGYQCTSTREWSVCVHISGDNGVWYVCDILYTVLYVCINCFVVHGCAVSRRYINVCNCDMFSVVTVYIDHLKLCVVCIHGQRYVCCSDVMLSLMSVMNPPPALCTLSVHTVVKLCTLGVFAWIPEY